MTIPSILVVATCGAFAACAYQNDHPYVSDMTTQPNTRSARDPEMPVDEEELSAVETVSADQIPQIAGGPGFHCHERRSERHLDGETTVVMSSRCERTGEDCRASAEKFIVQKPDSPHETFEHTTTECVEQSNAWCTYLWASADDGRHLCSVNEHHCKASMTAFNTPQQEIKQTECGEVG